MPRFRGSHYALAGSFLAYWLFVAFCAYFRRYDEWLYPSALFFLAFWLFPCIASWLTIFLARERGAVLRLLSSAAGVFILWFLAYLQLKPLARYALWQPDDHMQGLISNFYVSAPRIVDRPAVYAGILLVVMAIYGWRWLGPNNSFKPNPHQVH